MKTSSTTTITITLLDWARLPSPTQMLATATATVLLERDLSQGSKVVVHRLLFWRQIRIWPMEFVVAASHFA
jgi:hypothetical protein